MPGVIYVVRTILPLTSLITLSLLGLAEEAPDDPLRKLNGAFRRAYAEARTETVSGSRPLILVRGDDVTLLTETQRLAGSKVDRAYHDLKTIAHVPLAIHVLLAPYQEGEISEPRLERIRDLRELIKSARDAIVDHLDEPELARRQQLLLDQCDQFLAKIADAKSWKREDLLVFLRSKLPQIQENVRESVKLRIDNYHGQVMAWKSQLTAEEWSRLRVLIPGAALPRRQNLAVQYFCKLLGERGEGGRVLYAESRFAESEALDLLGTYVLDTQIGVDFFQDPWRMHRDLLGDAAAAYIDGLNFREHTSESRP